MLGGVTGVEPVTVGRPAQMPRCGSSAPLPRSGPLNGMPLSDMCLQLLFTMTICEHTAKCCEVIIASLHSLKADTLPQHPDDQFWKCGLLERRILELQFEFYQELNSPFLESRAFSLSSILPLYLRKLE